MCLERERSYREEYALFIIRYICHEIREVAKKKSSSNGLNLKFEFYAGPLRPNPLFAASLREDVKNMHLF